MADNTRSTRIGLAYGFAAYGLWGVVPIYFKNVQAVPPLELLAHRIVWSAGLLLILLGATGRLRLLRDALAAGRTLAVLFGSTIFIAVNWYVFIYSVVSGQIKQGSLGYFILPLVNVAMGTIFFHERMRRPQWIAVTLASAGILALVLIENRFPWIGLTLAFSFSLYGILRKTGRIDATVGLTAETLLLAPIAAGFLMIEGMRGLLVFGSAGALTNVLILMGGVVTSVPLLCFGQAVQRLRIVTIGFLQYISPTMAFLIAVFRYDEAFPLAYQIGYGLIWCGLAVFVVDALLRTRRIEVSEPIG